MDESAIARAFAERNGLVFRDFDLLCTALTHRSYLNEHPEVAWDDNERLEYLGDAVLDFLLAEALYRRFPQAREGELTGLRAALVRRDTLARFAEQIGIGEALCLGHGEVESGGRTRAATLCAAFEALVGALYLDQGLAAVARFVMPMVEMELADARVEAVDKDPKSRLQELAQSLLGVTPRYRTVKAEGPDHARIFTVEVYLGGVVCGVGEGHGKQAAAQQAAADALARQEIWARSPAGAETSGAPTVALEPDQPPPAAATGSESATVIAAGLG